MKSVNNSFIEFLSKKYNFDKEQELKEWEKIKPDESYVHQLFDIAFTEFGLTQETIKSKSRTNDIVKVRQYMMYLIYKQGFTYLNIGKIFGNRDHSTVVYACQQVADLLYIKDAEMMNVKTSFDNSLNEFKSTAERIEELRPIEPIKAIRRELTPLQELDIQEWKLATAATL